MNASENGEPNGHVLTDFVDVETLQALQDGFARLTGISTSIRDTAGKPITHTTCEPAFCTLLKSTPSGQQQCRACHKAAAELVQTTDLQCRTHCHAGLMQFVAPIIVEGQHLGAIIVGDRPATRLADSVLSDLAARHGIDPGELAEAAHELETWSEERLSLAIGFVQQLANTIAHLCYQAHQLRSRVDELAALYDVSFMLTASMELQDLLDGCTQKLLDTMGLRAAAIRLLDEESRELKIASLAHVRMNYVDTDVVQLDESPLDMQALERDETIYVADVQKDERTVYKERLRREGLVSALVTPLVSRKNKIGTLRVYTGHPHRFSAFERSLLEAVASQVASAIMTMRLRRDAQKARQLGRQMKLAGEVQRRMIPARPPNHPKYAFGCVYEPSSELGGDFYDFINLPNGETAIVVADVVGKGVPASLTMASTRATLRSLAKRTDDMAALMEAVNLRLCHDTQPAEFVTAFYGILSNDGTMLRYCNAGHEPLMLLRNGRVQTFDIGGLVLGIEETATYDCGEVALQPGDVLALVTDGMLEAMDYSEEAYGRERLHASLRLHGAIAQDMPTDLIASQLLWDVRRFVGLAPQSDDMTAVVIRVAGRPATRRQGRGPQL